MNITPIAHIHTDFKEKFGIPRQSGRVPSLCGEIVFEPEYRCAEALRGLDGFTHLWLIFDFSLAHRDDWSPTVRPPRLGGNRRMGVFATRSPFRPNNLGLSCVKLEAVKQRKDVGHTLIVSGIDLLDKTPIFDIKPYIPAADCRIDAKGGFSDETNGHRLLVRDQSGLLSGLPDAVADCIADDPRPSYQNDPDRVYAMIFGGFEIKFTVNNLIAEIIAVNKLT